MVCHHYVPISCLRLNVIHLRTNTSSVKGTHSNGIPCFNRNANPCQLCCCAELQVYGRAAHARNNKRETNWIVPCGVQNVPGCKHDCTCHKSSSCGELGVRTDWLIHVCRSLNCSQTQLSYALCDQSWRCSTAHILLQPTLLFRLDNMIWPSSATIHHLQ